MFKLNKKIILVSSAILFSSLFLSSCGKKPEAKKETPTPAVKLIELKPEEKPYISLIPREDGHELKLKISNIPDSIKNIEYELLYSAQDEGLEMEKGVGDTLKIDSKNIERNLLLGTESCTNGCKYKYDTGITGGTLSLTLNNASGQSATFETPFVFINSADLKKTGSLTLNTENFSIKATSSSKSEYFILMKNFGIPTNNKTTKAIYSVFSSGSGAGKVSSMNPDTVVKENKNTISGDYLVQ